MGVTVSVRAKLARPLNDALRPLHVQLVNGTSPGPGGPGFHPGPQDHRRGREGRPVSVSAYIDRTFAEPGTTPKTVEAMLEFADLHDKCETVCEVGPGSGRYAEEVVAALHPNAYEIYETATDWLPHLSKLPNAVIRDCDGRTLAQTPSGSVDLVHAHKTFVYLEFYVTAGDLDEMARVVRPGGAVGVRPRHRGPPGRQGHPRYGRRKVRSTARSRSPGLSTTCSGEASR